MSMPCRYINHALKLAENEGNTISEISNSELMDKVIWMNDKLSPDLRNRYKAAFTNLIYYKTKDKPHNPACESYICNECKTVLVLPA